LVEELTKLFDERSVNTPAQAHKKLSEKRDPDGSLTFCHAKWGEVKKYQQNSPEYEEWEGCACCGLKPCTGCNGKLLPEEDIKSFFSVLAAKRKKQKK
jgi:hypothetical protein